MRILKATHLGQCFGVRDALVLANRSAAEGPLTILGDLVHNETVVSDLRSRGVRIESQLEAVTTPTVMITAHGTSHRQRQSIMDRGHRVIEATCPLVRFAHDQVLELARAGYHPVIIGQRDHVEVRGLTGDLEAYDVVLTEPEIDGLESRLRFGVASQTTQPIARVRALVERLHVRFPDSEVRFVDTVCQPTKQRQEAAERLAAMCDVVIVVGGLHSNNTRQLAQTCGRRGSRVHQIQTAADLRPDWFRDAQTVGLTAGTSTPDVVIEAVERTLRTIGITRGIPAVDPNVAHPMEAETR
ncbi:MAG: 4-hydroxy-3-methylbut-2-enyl diphosphate reductase [Limisphaerales bacterium]